MKTYNLIGYLIIVLYILACMFFAPPHLGPWAGLFIGGVYFVSFWFLCGVYLADVLHMGIAHRALDYKEWFIKAVTIVNNSFGLYVNPISWVNRHRLHHKHADNIPLHQPVPKLVDSASPKNSLIFRSIMMPPSLRSSTHASYWKDIYRKSQLVHISCISRLT